MDLMSFVSKTYEFIVTGIQQIKQKTVNLYITQKKGQANKVFSKISICLYD